MRYCEYDGGLCECGLPVEPCGKQAGTMSIDRLSLGKNGIHHRIICM